MKIAALDMGDQWIGIALSDSLQMIAAPFITVKNKELGTFLSTFLSEQSVVRVVVGCPITMRGTHSEQTKKVIAHKEVLEKIFPTVQFLLWDERFSSQRATALKPARTHEEKIKTHARAAAFILESYLSSLALAKEIY